MQNVQKIVQDKVSVSSSEGARTMYHTVSEGALNCISMNRDSTRVVAAGRNVFKVFAVEDAEFIERANLRVGKLNLNFSATDVTWNPVEDNIIASAATNGAVVTWDLDKPSRSKQDLVFMEHKRTVNRVCFHTGEAHILLSGSQDGFMKLFDLRKKGVSSTFNGKSEYVRDVQFTPHHYFTFAAAFENGNVQIWDMRNPNKQEKQFTAHSGPVFAIDWHLDDKTWLATAGRDRMIKVWDLSPGNKIKDIYSIQSIASVARIKWRPQRKYHISSCALLLDFSINIWDVRRPYIPFASFNEHKDVVTGIVWKHNDPHVFLSSSRDCTIYQHMFRDATRPADKANPVGIAINCTGDICHATSDKMTGGLGNLKLNLEYGSHASSFKEDSIYKLSGMKSGNYSSTKLPSFFRKNPDRSEQFTKVSSSVVVYGNYQNELSMQGFIKAARHYRLTGKPLEELCAHNASVAENLQIPQVAQTWTILKSLYTSTSPSPSQNLSTHSVKPDSHSHKESDGERARPPTDGLLITENKSVDLDIKDKHLGDTSTGVSDEESDIEGNEVEKNLAHIASGLANTNSDFFFGDAEVESSMFEYEPLSGVHNGQDWQLPSEAFQPRHAIEENAATPDPLSQNNPQDSPSSANESDFSNSVHHVPSGGSGIKQELLLMHPFTSHLPSWEFTAVVCDMLLQHAERGDVQTAVSALIILGDRIRPHISEHIQEHWLTSYLDLLARYKLWTVATEVIKLSNHPAVSVINQQSTTFHTNCSRCGKPLQRVGWLCDRCKDTTINVCSICHHPVKGLYVWCQGCSHGGHLQHIRDWLSTNTHCPTGCGHLCEYT